MEYDLDTLSVRALNGLRRSKEHDIEIMEKLSRLMLERLDRERSELTQIEGVLLQRKWVG